VRELVSEKSWNNYFAVLYVKYTLLPVFVTEQTVINLWTNVTKHCCKCFFGLIRYVFCYHSHLHRFVASATYYTIIIITPSLTHL
jgi:hypothetical protein